MPITICANLHYEAMQPCEFLLQIEAESDPMQRCIRSNFSLHQDPGSHLVRGHDDIGMRRWVNETRIFRCKYEATFEIDRPAGSIKELAAARVSQTPSEITEYLMPSRYCHPEAFFEVLSTQFGHLSGGALVGEISRWIGQNFTYDCTTTNPGTTATDSFAARSGVCRDYAHVLIAMVRAAGIPARFTSVYAPDVEPQDFHAVGEVFLEGAWHIVDPTGMAHPNEVVRIGVGRDAADVSFLTSYGQVTLVRQTVEVTRAVKASTH